MAKTVKFNLICDGYPARTIEDLQKSFFCRKSVTADIPDPERYVTHSRTLSIN